MEHVIDTMAGVIKATDPQGAVVLTRGDGDTVTDMRVRDNAGNEVIVYLSADMAVSLSAGLMRVAYC